VDIDRAAKDFGMPMGPIELADTVGLDVCLHVAKLLSAAYNYNIPESFEAMVKAGTLGKKTGKGFYIWKKGKKFPPKSKISEDDQQMIQDRLIFRLLNEAVACHRESVVANKDYLDAGVIFGTGFAPFRGGPINYIESMSVAYLLGTLKALNDQHGSRYEPDPGWEKLVR
jgi:3-hydroxyacyl-CoA dehydrogenase/enoyl-CoA hydratase/3-hydroxybutyryl-CoA epimerase